MAGLNRRFTLAAVALSLLLVAMPGMARASGTVTNCTTFGPGAGTLDTALMGGGAVTFACSGTIIVPEIDILSGTTSIDATGQSVTLSGNNANRVFSVSGATLNLTNLTLAHGSTVLDGGGIFNGGGTVTVTNSTLSGNTGGNGGGIENNGGMLTVTNSTFSNNQALADAGGSIDNGGTVTVTNSTLSDNSAFDGGGGIFNSGKATVTNSTFSGNNITTAGDGGGIDNINTLTVTNSTFSGNSASSGDGGGIFNNDTLKVTNSTFSGNASEFGGGVDNDGGSATLKGTILAAEPSGNCSGTITDAGYNISDDGTCGFTTPPIGTSINNSTSLNLDPLGLDNNGGPTQTIALEPNSEAVDFIPVASCKDQSLPTPLPLTTDQRGFPRPDSGNLAACDAGAFESQTGRLAVVSGSERTQIARSTSGTSDKVNMAFTFFDNGSPILDDPPSIVGPHCDDGTDALNGIDVDLFEGTCASLSTATGGLLLDLSPFVMHTVNHESYGTLFQASPAVPSPETVSVRILQLAKPFGTCGQWTINIEVAGLDTAAIGLGGGNPFALVVEDGDKNEGCFDVNNAIVGSQTPPPPHGVRRRVRR